MNWFYKLIRKLFLIKEIISRSGVVHFRRYRLLSTPWFNIYIHNILKSDEDSDMHDHPFDFTSVILSGAYYENFATPPEFEINSKAYYAGDVIEHKAEDVHKITLLSKEVWTLVFTSGRNRMWGYHTDRGWLNHKDYRHFKNLRWTKYGVKVTIYNSTIFENWVWKHGSRFETTDREEAQKFAEECEMKNSRGLYSVQEIKE